jgi:hypothetical protein
MPHKRTFIVQVCSAVIRPDSIVDLCDGTGNEDREHEGNDIKLVNLWSKFRGEWVVCEKLTNPKIEEHAVEDS